MELKVKNLLNLLKDINYREWRIIANLIEREYVRVANKNVPEDTETLLKNIMQEIN